MDKIVAPINAQDKGQPVANLQQAMLFIVEKKQFSPADQSLDQWKQVMSDELAQQLFGQRTLQLLLALLPALHLPAVELVTPQVAVALNYILQDLGAFAPVPPRFRPVVRLAPVPSPTPAPTPVPLPVEEAPFMVHGQVRQADFSLFVGAVVQASDTDLRSEELLGQAITDQQGRYEIKYTADQFRRAEKGTADLIVRVYANSSAAPANASAAPALATSPITFNAPPVATVDFVIGGGTYPGPSEYEQLESELVPLLEVSPPVQPVDLTNDDIAFLAGETGLASDQIAIFAAAARLAAQTELPPEVFYGFARENLPTDLHALLAQGRQAQERALQSALKDNIIQLRFNTGTSMTLNSALDSILEKLQQRLSP